MFNNSKLLKNLLILSSILSIQTCSIYCMFHPLPETKESYAKGIETANELINSETFSKLDLQDKKLILDYVIIQSKFFQPDKKLESRADWDLFSKLIQDQNTLSISKSKNANIFSYALYHNTLGRSQKFWLEVGGLIFGKIKNELNALELVEYALILSGLK